ncbi:hypothetical protein FZO89_04770 [Luteimonas viscosa]|uniref:Uncharacterized protein n=1 Tax=Luteimonas viscosa TaxID=1132694 RepID=A0A5D4XNU2_9GAMM|nr:hypothetical protein [Luteimonas viscosa]TYT25625.1 hypothetical protein FZO89_04770 [Luteimonas viscosa]
MRAHLLMFLGLACVAGCRTLPADPPEPVAKVDVALVPPPAGATRMQLDSSQAFVFPQLLESPMPAYPPDVLALRLPPLELCVEVDIGSDGTVTAVSPRSDDGCRVPEASHAARFAAAVGQAVRLWRYDPALVCRMPDGRGVDDACAEPDAVETPVALRLSYAFVFSQQDGKPSVELASGAR